MHSPRKKEKNNFQFASVLPYALTCTRKKCKLYISSTYTVLCYIYHITLNTLTLFMLTTFNIYVCNCFFVNVMSLCIMYVCYKYEMVLFSTIDPFT